MDIINNGMPPLCTVAVTQVCLGRLARNQGTSLIANPHSVHDKPLDQVAWADGWLQRNYELMDAQQQKDMQL